MSNNATAANELALEDASPFSESDFFRCQGTMIVTALNQLPKANCHRVGAWV